jgi:hypothetical protein
VTSVPGGADREFVTLGRAENLARFLAEYDLEQDDVNGLVAERMPPGTGGKPEPPEYQSRPADHAARADQRGQWP